MIYIDMDDLKATPPKIIQVAKPRESNVHRIMQPATADRTGQYALHL